MPRRDRGGIFQIERLLEAVEFPLESIDRPKIRRLVGPDRSFTVVRSLAEGEMRGGLSAPTALWIFFRDTAVISSTICRHSQTGLDRMPDGIDDTGWGGWRTRILMFELSVRKWLESDYLHYLRRVARRVAYTYHLSDADVPDLYQEICLALWKAGPERMVNATWIFHTANHRAIELYNGKQRANRFSATVGAEGTAPGVFADPERALLVHARADRLPRSLRRFYRLRFQEGYTQSELMQRAHLTRGSIRGLEKECFRRLLGRHH